MSTNEINFSLSFLKSCVVTVNLAGQFFYSLHIIQAREALDVTWENQPRQMDFVDYFLKEIILIIEIYSMTTQ